MKNPPFGNDGFFFILKILQFSFLYDKMQKALYISFDEKLFFNIKQKRSHQMMRALLLQVFY